VLEAIAPTQFANQPVLWGNRFPWPTPDGHKYSRGHAVVVGGGINATGAARLAARAALRSGAGLVTVACPPGALVVYAGALEAVMVRAVADHEAFASMIADRRKNAVLIGPGNGVTDATKARTLAALTVGKACVLDADALTVFQDNPVDLFSAVSPDTVLTPHDGEFSRLFNGDGDRLTRARAAAACAGCVVLLKGGDTVIAAPDGRAAINYNAPPDLATAGAGDVLAGMVLGLRAQGMAGFDAACAAAWLHGDAAARFGPGLIAEDLCETLPASLAVLKACN
jgi:NAD(P)H-hydrate epimerase